MFSPFRNPSLELNSRTETRTAESQTPKRRLDSIAASRRATTSSRHYDLTDLAVRLQGSVIFASGNVLATIGVPLVGAIAAAHNADGLGDERLVVGIEGRAGLEQIMDVSQISKVYAQLDPPLWLVTAAAGGRRGGLIATTVAQASIVSEMPRQLITVNKRHHTHALIEGNGAFAMHLIDETQLDLVWRFGLQSGRDVDKFTGLLFRNGATGSPLLPEALGWFDCRVEARMDSGDRTIYLAAVVDGRMERTGPPLTNRCFFDIAPPDKQNIMNEQYEHDARLDAVSIQQWRDQKRITPLPSIA